MALQDCFYLGNYVGKATGECGNSWGRFFRSLAMAGWNQFVGAMGGPAADYFMAEVFQRENLRTVPIEFVIARPKPVERLVVSVFN